MRNPGLKRNISDEPFIRVIFRRTATTNPVMPAPKTKTVDGYQTGINDHAETLREDVETPPPLMGGPTVLPVPATNGEKIQDRDLYTAANRFVLANFIDLYRTGALSDEQLEEIKKQNEEARKWLDEEAQRAGHGYEHERRFYQDHPEAREQQTYYQNPMIRPHPEAQARGVSQDQYPAPVRPVDDHENEEHEEDPLYFDPGHVVDRSRFSHQFAIPEMYRSDEPVDLYLNHEGYQNRDGLGARPHYLHQWVYGGIPVHRGESWGPVGPASDNHMEDMARTVANFASYDADRFENDPQAEDIENHDLRRHVGTPYHRFLQNEGERLGMAGIEDDEDHDAQERGYGPYLVRHSGMGTGQTMNPGPTRPASPSTINPGLKRRPEKVEDVQADQARAQLDMTREQNEAARQRQIAIQQQVGGGEKENPAYDRAQQQVEDKIMTRNMRPVVANSGLEVNNYEGEEGNLNHITRIERGMVPIEWVQSMPGARGEKPGEHRNHQGYDWNQFKEALRLGRGEGIQSPLFINVDHDKHPVLAEGNHRRDAYAELGATHVPVEIRYYGHAERQGTVGDRATGRRVPGKTRGFDVHLRDQVVQPPDRRAPDFSYHRDHEWLIPHKPPGLSSLNSTSSQSTGIDVSPGRHQDAYSAYLNRVLNRVSHPLHQAAIPNDDPVYPYSGRVDPEDTVDVDNLQSGDDTYRPNKAHNPLLDRVNDIINEGGDDSEESERGRNALAEGLNTIFDSVKESQGEGGLSREEQLQRAKDAIDAHFETGQLSHKEHVRRLHDDWEARGGHKTGEPIPVERFSPRYKHKDGQYIVSDPANPFPQSQSTIRYKGDCKGCGISMFMDDAGDMTDPRGAIGDHTPDNMRAEDYDMHGPDIPTCFNCSNDSDKYHRLLDRGQGHKAGDMTGGGYWGWPEGADLNNWKAREFIPTRHTKDKKGLWHNPGEKPGSCPDCGPMQSEASAIGSLSTGTRLSPGQDQDAYSKHMNRVSARHSHPLHQAAIDENELSNFLNRFKNQPSVEPEDELTPTPDDCKTCWEKYRGVVGRDLHDQFMKHPFNPFEKTSALVDRYVDEPNNLRFFYDSDLDHTKMPSSNARRQPMFTLKDDEDYGESSRSQNYPTCQTCFLANGDLSLPPRHADDLEMNSHEMFYGHPYVPLEMKAGERFSSYEAAFDPGLR